MNEYKELVFNSLDNALENEYDISSWNTTEAALDVIYCHDELHGMDLEECKVYVAEWQDMKLQEKRKY